MTEKHSYKDFTKAPIRTDRKPLQDLLPLAQPLRILIDPSDICNFRCSYCFQSYDKGFKGQVMSIELFKQIVEQLKEFESPINVIHLYGLGEPMVNKNLPDFVSILKKEGVAKEIAITSNGSLMEKECSQRLVDAGLDRLSISLNGIKDEHFEKNVSRKVCFEKIYEQIKYFYSIKKQCHLHVKINGECFTEEEKETFVSLFKDHCDTLNIDHVVNVWSSIQMTGGGQTMYENELSENAICPQMFYEMLIHSNGSVSPCCVDYTYKKENLGNIQEKSIKEIWNGDKLMEMRRQALKGERISYAICNGCSYPVCASTVNLVPYREELIKKF